MALFVGFLLILSGLEFAIGYQFRKVCAESNRILCTPQDVVEATLWEYGFGSERSRKGLAYEVTIAKGERIAANLIQVVEGRKRWGEHLAPHDMASS